MGDPMVYSNLSLQCSSFLIQRTSELAPAREDAGAIDMAARADISCFGDWFIWRLDNPCV